MPQGTIVNLADRRARASQKAQLELLELGPDTVVAELRRIQRAANPGAAARPGRTLLLPHLALPAHHEVTADDVVMRRLHATLASATSRGPRDFTELLETPGVGARTVAALASVAEVVHGAPCRFSDPARFSFAHGGKDGHPFPVPLRVYDQTIRVMKEAVERAKLGRDDKLAAIRRLDAEARRLEPVVRGRSFATLIEDERKGSFAHGGRTVTGVAAPPVASRRGGDQNAPAAEIP
jgi:hypothetical protein